MTDYKAYQQVLSIGVKRNGAKPKKVAKPKTQCASVKRRTKTGCLTCRKRKKKCDEDRVNGKCQGCTRNFLECCWPEEHAEVKLAPSAVPESVPTTPKLSSSLASPSPVPQPVLAQAKPQAGKCTIESMLATPIHNPYPSPIQSPISEVKSEEEKEVQYLALPPSAYKQAQQKQSAVREQPPKAQSKFIITSFNTDNDLCSVN